MLLILNNAHTFVLQHCLLRTSFQIIRLNGSPDQFFCYQIKINWRTHSVVTLTLSYFLMTLKVTRNRKVSNLSITVGGPRICRQIFAKTVIMWLLGSMSYHFAYLSVRVSKGKCCATRGHNGLETFCKRPHN